MGSDIFTLSNTESKKFKLHENIPKGPFVKLTIGDRHHLFVKWINQYVLKKITYCNI